MNTEPDPNTLIYIGIFAALTALGGASVAHVLDDGVLRLAALAVTYIFGVNAVVLLGYELQQRTAGHERTAGHQPAAK